MSFFTTVTSHREEALAMFKSGAPVSKMVALRMKNLSAMKSSGEALQSSSSVLQAMLSKAEEEAMSLVSEGDFVVIGFNTMGADETEQTDTSMMDTDSEKTDGVLVAGEQHKTGKVADEEGKHKNDGVVDGVPTQQTVETASNAFQRIIARKLSIVNDNANGTYYS